MSISYQSIFDKALSLNASDIHICQDQGVRYIVNKRMIAVSDNLSIEDIKEFIRNVTGQEDIGKSRDFSFTYKENRFRGNAYQTSNGVSIALRVLFKDVPTFDSVGIPQEIRNLTNVKDGLILFCGSVGSGKSTTIASMIDYFNHSMCGHIITAEDPIEYVFKPDKCLISQREVGLHCDSFSSAAHDAVRQNPNVFMIGEIRDADTAVEAIRLAKSGCLIIASLHSDNVANAPKRLIDLFPDGLQSVAKNNIINVTKAIVHQYLIQSKDLKKRYLLPEVLIMTNSAKVALREGRNINQVRDIITMDKSQGSISCIESACDLIKKHSISISDLKELVGEECFSLIERRSSCK